MRKIVSMIVLVGVVLVAGRLLGVFGEGLVPLEIHYLLGDPPVCAALEVTFTPAGTGEVAATFATRLVGPDVKHSTRLPGTRPVSRPPCGALMRRTLATRTPNWSQASRARANWRSSR